MSHSVILPRFCPRLLVDSSKNLEGRKSGTRSSSNQKKMHLYRILSKVYSRTMNKFLRKNAIYIVFLLVVMAFMTIIFVWARYGFFQRFGLKFDLTISISFLLNIILAFFMAIIMPQSFWRALEKKRSARDLLMYNCSELRRETVSLMDFIKEVVKNKNSENGDLYILAHFKRLGSIVEFIRCHAKEEFWEFDGTEELWDKFLKFRAKATDDIRIAGFQFDEKHYFARTYLAFLDFESEIERLKFKINAL